MCVLSIKVPIRKKSGNLLKAPRIYMFVFIFCVYNSCFIQGGLEFIYEFFFIWSNRKFHVWAWLSNLPWLYSYRRLDTFNFLFSGIWYRSCRAIFCNWGLVLTLYMFLYICYIWLNILNFLSRSRSFAFIYSEFYFPDFKGIGFYFYNYITYSTTFIFAFSNSRWCVFPECRRGEYSF